MSMSNIEYSALKRSKGGLHNWGFLNTEDFETDLETETMDDFSDDFLQQNSFGEYYALQDFEE